VFFCGVSVLFIVVTVLLMSPRQVVSTTRSFSGVDVVFAVDVSLSMHADDILPSRMDATAQ
jgi:Mg-chelatase subunit ChlD